MTLVPRQPTLTVNELVRAISAIDELARDLARTISALTLPDDVREKLLRAIAKIDSVECWRVEIEDANPECEELMRKHGMDRL